MNLQILPRSAPLLAMMVILAGSHACTILEPPVESGAVLFQDDFSRTASGWDRYQDDTYETDYVEGGYIIRISAPETYVWARPYLDFSDVRIHVLATKVGGPDNNLFGVICRYQDASNFYFFLISSDGFSGIGVYKDGEENLLSGVAMLPSAAILQGSTSNLLRADCIGDELSLYINGHLETKVKASEWDRGDVGLMAGTYTQAGVEILFEKFSVVKP